MSKLTDEYGEFISLHEGVGNLNDIVCSFEVGQKPDSTIIFHCSSKEVFDPDAMSIEFAGTIGDGTQIWAKGNAFPRCALTFDSYSASQCYFRSFAGFRLSIGAPDWSNVHEVRFSIANFVFCGKDEMEDGRGNGREKLEIKVGDFEAYFEKLGNYEDIVELILHKDRPGITCELVINIADHTWEEVIEFANYICILLALSSCRTVDWVNMRLFDSKSSFLCCHYQHRRISGASQFDMIDFGDLEVAVTYLTQCYPTFKQINPKFHIDTAAFILGDLRPHPLLETRALLLYSIVDSFTKKVSVNNSFESRLKHLLNTYGVCYKSKEARLFARSRNSIAHEFQFMTENGMGAKEEYFRNLNLFHRLLLRMLGYEFYYIDVTKLPHRSESRKHKLKVCNRTPAS